MGRRGWFRIILAGALLGQPIAASAAALVLRSVGPSARIYRPGQRLPDAGLIRLRDGDSLTILFRGQTRVFRGRGTYSPMSTPRRAEYAGVYDRRRASGGVRGPGDMAALVPDSQLIDTRQPQTACVLPGASPTLWRPVAVPHTRVAYTVPGGREAVLSWPSGAVNLGLPSDVPDGTIITVTPDGQNTATTITVARISPDVANADAVAEALLERGCRAQLDAFVIDQAGPAPRE